MPLAAGEERILGFALFGAPMLESQGFRFQPYEARLSAEYLASVSKVGEVYKQSVKDAFNRTHGRTGKTGRTVASMWSPNVRMTEGAPAVYTVKLGGSISYVINPIPGHFIETPTKHGHDALYNPMYGNWPGREINYYSVFGPMHTVFWAQGISNESYSPDTTWYHGEVQQKLETEGIAMLHRLAPFAVNLWGETMNPPTAPLAVG